MPPATRDTLLVAPRVGSPRVDPTRLDAWSVRRVHASVLDAVGDTPLIEVTGFLDRPAVRLYVKLEAANPGGSAKDRPAVAMIRQPSTPGRSPATR